MKCADGEGGWRTKLDDDILIEKTSKSKDYYQQTEKMPRVSFKTLINRRNPQMNR